MTGDDQLRQALHDFAVSYHVESPDGREADLDHMLALIRQDRREQRIDELSHVGLSAQDGETLWINSVNMMDAITIEDRIDQLKSELQHGAGLEEADHE